MKNRVLALVIFTGLFLAVTSPIIAETRIALIPLEMEGDEAYCESLTATVKDTLFLTLRVMDSYDIIKIPEEEWKNSDREKIIKKYELEQVLIGKVTVTETGESELSFQIYHTEYKRISPVYSIKALDYMDIYNKIAALLVDIIEESIQDYLSYGSLSITNDGSASEYWISLDEQELGKNIREIPIIPTGSYNLKIYTKTETEVNLVDFYKFELYRKDHIGYKFRLDSNQKFSREKPFELKDGRTLNMTNKQWKELKKSSPLSALNKGGIGMLIAAPLILSGSAALISYISDIENTQGLFLPSNGGPRELSHEAANYFYYIPLGILSVTGGAIATAGIIILISSVIIRKKIIKEEFELYATPVITPKTDGMLTAGISINIKI